MPPTLTAKHPLHVVADQKSIDLVILTLRGFGGEVNLSELIECYLI